MFRKMFYKFVSWAAGYGSEEKPRFAKSPTSRASIPSMENWDENLKGITFKVFNAGGGGKVIQTHIYDPTKAHHSHNLYIINDNDDFGKEIEMIITRELLAR